MDSGTTVVLRQTFNKLDETTLESLRTLAHLRHYPPGTVLCRQGNIEHTFYIVVEGRVAVSQKQESGQPRLLSMIGPNGYFGEMGLLDNTPRVATITTVAPTTVLEVNEELFDQIVEASPSVAYTITRGILATARENDRRAIEDLQAKNDALEKAYADLQAAQAELVGKERLERELELAADVQRKLLPDELPQIPGYNFAFFLKPARQVGGDFYDVSELDEDHVGILIADVADKGFHAALFMAVTRTLFLQEGKRFLSPAQVALAVHEGMLEVSTQDDVFVTAFYGVLNKRTNVLNYVRAAQERPLLYRPGEPLHVLSGNGRFLGMLPGLTLQEYSVQLQSGDRLLLYSDGVTDSINWDEEPYDHERLLTAVAVNGHLSATELIQHIADDITEWCQGAPPFDDLTMLVVEVK